MISYHPASANAAVGTANPAYGWKHADTKGDLSRIAECMRKFVWSPIVFKADHRIATAFHCSHYLALDFEDFEFTLEHALNDFCDIKHVIGTTRNHQVPKGGQCIDRFRVVMPWDEPITDVNVYLFNMLKLTSRYDCDIKCKDAARLFYPCKEIVSVNLDGFSFDVSSVPENFLTPDRYKEISRAKGKSGVMSRFASRWLRNVMPTGTRNDSCFYLGMDLARCGLEFERALELVLHSPTYENGVDPKLFKEIHDALANGFKAEQGAVKNG